MGTHVSKSGRSSASGAGKATTDTLVYNLGRGSYTGKVEMDVSFQGTDEEVDRAFEIAGFITGSVLNKAESNAFALDHPHIASESQKKAAEIIKKQLGENATSEQWVKKALSDSKDLQYLRSERSASEVIKKYGDRVPTGSIDSVNRMISSNKINALRTASRRKAESAEKARADFVKKNGYSKTGSTIEIKTKLPSNLSGITKITGKTYEYRNEIKKAGFKWNGEAWVKK